MRIKQKTNFARELRKNKNLIENQFWYFLRNRRFFRLKFRRQHVIGPFVADFCCISKKLIIELDGGQHNGGKQETRDRKRTEYLEKQGYRVIRFWNNEVLEKKETVLAAIRNALKNPHPYPSPSKGRGNSGRVNSLAREAGEGGRKAPGEGIPGTSIPSPAKRERVRHEVLGEGIRHLTLFFIILFIANTPAFAQAQGPVWQKISMGVLEAHFGSLTTSSVTPRILFLDSQDSLYRTLDEGRHWSRVFQLPGDLKSKIHRVYISPHRSDVVYLATSEGLFISRDLGNHFEILFSSAQTKERSCFSVAFHSIDPDILFLGTGGGLFWTLDGGEMWNRASSDFSDGEIIKITPNPKNDRSFLILTRTSLYALDEKSGALKTLFSLPAGNEERDPDDTLEEEENKKINTLNDLAVIPGQNEKILLATQAGILENSGSGWISFPMYGLKSQEISEIIALSSERLFIATPNGIYWFIESGKRWEELKNGLDKTDSSDLEYHPSQGGLLYTVTSSGVFKLSLPNSIEMPGIEIESIQINAENIQFLKDYTNEEPDLRSIHRAAIRYADVNPEKIKNWQRDSRLSHFLPKLSGGVRRATDETVDIDRGATNTSDLFITGPNERSWSYDAGVSWDLAELVWSSNQTSIDSRSKLMTELRNEILSNLTRLYFERKRLVTEFFLKPPSDELLRIELIQHIEELTAHIDAYTGNYFSEEMERRGITSPWDYSPAPGGDEAGRMRH